jgi:hypothetical protein
MTYFSAPGRENLHSTVALAKKRTEELGIGDVVIATTTGFTAKAAVEVFKDTGAKLTFVGTGRERFPVALLQELASEGYNVCFSHEIQYDYPDEMKAAYRRFCEGMKVAVEIAAIAAQQGYVPTDRDVVSVGKWDTAIVIRAATFGHFEDLKIRELLCKPR